MNSPILVNESSLSVHLVFTSCSHRPRKVREDSAKSVHLYKSSSIEPFYKTSSIKTPTNNYKLLRVFTRDFFVVGLLLLNLLENQGKEIAWEPVR